MLIRAVVALAACSGIAAQTQYTSTATAAVAKAAATALTLSPTSNVKGLTFDRFVQIFLENTDYSSAVADRELRSCQVWS
jgi:hypothetical protein